MSQSLRLSGLMRLVDAALGSDQTLLQRPLLEQTRTTSLVAGIAQSITTTEAAIAIGNVTSPGYAALQNEETNTSSSTYISIGFTVSATFYEAFRLGPKEFAIVPLSPSRTWQAKTNSSTAILSGFVLQRNP